MKKYLIILVLFALAMPGNSQEKTINVLVIGAHPDDCDGDAGGTAILFAEMGHRVKFLSLTNGDAGHYAMGGGQLAKRRTAEAAEAGRRFGIEYKVMDNHDGELMPTLENRLDVIREIRRWNTDVVITHRPNDYHPDHRYTSILVQDAAFMVTVPNIAPNVPALKRNPVFLYSEDRFQTPVPFRPDIAVVIDDVYDQKIYAMAAHASQYFEWLPWLRGNLEKVPETEEERLKLLAGQRTYTPDEETRECLRKWYGNEADDAMHAEAFEICEYGRQPGDDEIRKLFPMLEK
ncbi:MAG: PIG-L family deacetylase [Bacteroidales bacterium]|nr:PIG-L family deacetylase [Bacteroidales bacterium]